MGKEKPLVTGEYLLQKPPQKGAWTYAAMPALAVKRKGPFGWVRVKGTIDGYVLKQYKLMPMGNGNLFLPVKAEVRKQINKQAGDFVNVTLYLDETPLELPEEISLCFQNEPKKVYEKYLSLTEGEQKKYLDWIYAAKTEDTKANRIAAMIDELMKSS